MKDEKAARPDAHSAEKTIGEFVAGDYRTAAVFEKYGIDFCCGGKVVLSAVCREKGIDLDEILREITAVGNTPLARSHDYAAWDLSFLSDYIITVHHAYLWENLPQFAASARKVAQVHGANHPEVMEIAAIFDRIAGDMDAHLREEEEVLFPTIRKVEVAGKTGAVPDAKDMDTIGASLERLIREHDEVGEAVHEIRRLSSNYTLPSDACNTFMVTYRKLREFEDDLHKHVHLENNILFPKAARLHDQGLAARK
ncbi:MAG: iron-sulfur cluster repair di-iron protein [Geobacteraceae bacterium]|nr:iron-sulfur cluster repair di-iron protein [Geobacteraceae bacterium]